MDELVKIIYDTYLAEEKYDNKILQDEKYKELMCKIMEYDEIMKKKLENHGSSDALHFINEYSSLNDELCQFYRYYDFTYGFTSGIALGLMTKELNNENFIKKLTELLNDGFNRDREDLKETN